MAWTLNICSLFYVVDVVVVLHRFWEMGRSFLSGWQGGKRIAKIVARFWVDRQVRWNVLVGVFIHRISSDVRQFSHLVRLGFRKG